MEKKPTEAQVKEFWEWCGWKWHYAEVNPELGIKYRGSHWVSPDGNQYIWTGTPPIDLNNLFKYAVPKLYELSDFRLLNYQYIGFSPDIELLRHNWSIHFENDARNKYQSGNDPALALFWAIYEALVALPDVHKEE